MRQYVLFFTWLLAITILGIAESAVAVPVFSLGLLFFLVKYQQWWLRLIALTVVAVIWGVALALSPTLLVGVLLTATWFDAWLSTKIQQKTSNYWSTIVVSLLIGVIRGAPVTVGSAIIFLLQAGLFWIVVRWLQSNRSKNVQFFIPPRPVDVKKPT